MTAGEIVADPGRVRAARPRRRRLPHEREVAGLRPGPGRPPLRRRPRLPGGPGRLRRSRPARAQPLRGSRGSGHRRRRRRGGGDHRRPSGRVDRRHRRARDGRSARLTDGAISASTSWAAAATSTSRSSRSRAPTCWARRRSCSRASRAGAASPSSSRPITTTKGLHGKPTLVHNPQTLAVIPGIITGGPETYRRGRSDREHRHGPGPDLGRSGQSGPRRSAARNPDRRDPRPGRRSARAPRR